MMNKLSFPIWASAIIFLYGWLLLVPANLTLVASVIFTILALLSVIFCVQAKPKLELTPTNSRMKQHWLSLGLLTGLLAVGGQLIFFQLATFWQSSASLSLNTQTIVETVKKEPFFILTTIFAAPLLEELVFRRAMLGLLAEFSPYFWLNALLSACAFATVHQDNHFFVYVLLGLLFAGVYKLTGKIGAAILAHTLMNTLVMLILLFASP